MESLVFYHRLQLRNHSSRLTDTDKQGIVQRCLQLLNDLQAVDSPRRQRYIDLCEQRSSDLLQHLLILAE